MFGGRQGSVFVPFYLFTVINSVTAVP